MYTDPILRLNSYPLIVVEIIVMITTLMGVIINNNLLLEIRIRKGHWLTLIQIIKIIVPIKDSIDTKIKRFSSCI